MAVDELADTSCQNWSIYFNDLQLNITSENISRVTLERMSFPRKRNQVRERHIPKSSPMTGT